ncbi:NTPase KAP family P-loop domain-containing protein 1 isoform X2 [Carcharodon carcharias]|uniref:NTPase KAP family P-loop domain-containing protein 1 isoform X2 n=1 Tax=Carcharodon carcharias TaxID=13397 RepID=UPI001B7E38B6|nr:NTPase KAP family P-loop domain-containing protein 1 isoform X2 [Carcharodon carcharias]
MGQTEYDTYAKCLGKALCYIPTPMTVGLYARWGSGINRLLHNVERQMISEVLNREKKELTRTQEKPRTATGLGFVSLLLHLVFLQPQLTEQHQKRKNVRFIFIQFSAWQFAGSEKLWAGLITTLCDSIKDQFGCIPTSIVRALGHQATVQTSESSCEWVSKKILGIPVWLIFSLLLLIALALLLVISKFGFSVDEMGNDYLMALEGVGFGLIGCSALLTMKNSVMVGKNILVSQRAKMESLMNKSDFSAQLGFMNDVKQEIKILTNFIHYIEIFERRKIRIVLKIVSLDRCTPDKVVGVLDAMNILLSDLNAPFISVLAVDPSIIVACVENSNTLKGMADNGYEFLNRIVTLPFSVPKMDSETKLNFIQQIVDGKSALMEDTPLQPERPVANKCQGNPLEIVPLITISSGHGQPSKERNGNLKTGHHIRQVYQCLVERESNLHDYIEDNFLQMRRIVNIIPIMVGLMLERNVPMSSFPPQRIAAWVILASCWPCRLSWIWQCLEDEEQRNELSNEKNINDNMLLWTIFENSSDRLILIQSSIEKLLTLDGDPEIFQKFLSISYKFTVKDAKIILPYTINLDCSLKRKMELLLGSRLLGRRAISSPANAMRLE